MALNDELFANRDIALQIISRIAHRNPAYCLPALRKKLIDILLDLEYSSDGHFKEESSRLLSLMISSAGPLIKPNVDYILNQIVPLIRDPSPRVASCILKVVGEMAKVAERDINTYMTRLLPLIVECIQDQSSEAKREAAYHTLGLLIFHSGQVVTVIRYPRLLDSLISAINNEKSLPVRHEVVKVMGLIGAVDPHNLSLRSSSNSTEDEKPSSDETAEEKQIAEEEELSSSLHPTSDEYYPTIAILFLTRILRDVSLTTHHTSVAQAIMYVFKSQGIKCTNYLPQVSLSVFCVCILLWEKRSRTSKSKTIFFFFSLSSGASSLFPCDAHM